VTDVTLNATDSSSRALVSILRRRARDAHLALVVTALVVGAVAASKSPYFLTTTNLLNLAEAVSILGILAIAQTPVLISGGLDLSIGSISGMAGVTAALTVNHTGNPATAILVAIAVGVGAGIVNGLLVTFGRVNAIIATLATLSVFEGLALFASDGQVVPLSNNWLLSWATTRPLGIPLFALMTLVFLVLVGGFLATTRPGRYVYALGGSAHAARLAGLPIVRFRIAIFTFSGAVAGFAGLLYATRASSAEPLQSQGIELTVVTAVILGGASLAGGRGTVIGSLLGVIVLGELQNAMVLTSVPTYYQYLLQGSLLAGAVMLHEYQRPAMR
jgi:L-arabinose transport system permease protein